MLIVAVVLGSIGAMRLYNKPPSVLSCPDRCTAIGMVVREMNLTTAQCVCQPTPPVPKCDKAWERTDDVLTLYSSCREALNSCVERNLR